MGLAKLVGFSALMTFISLVMIRILTPKWHMVNYFMFSWLWYVGGALKICLEKKSSATKNRTSNVSKTIFLGAVKASARAFCKTMWCYVKMTKELCMTPHVKLRLNFCVLNSEPNLMFWTKTQQLSNLNLCFRYTPVLWSVIDPVSCTKCQNQFNEHNVYGE